MEANQTNDILTPPQRVPSTLNVLTILTFIGCGLGYLGLIINFFTYSNYPEQVAKMQEMQDKVGDNGFAGKMVSGSLEIMEKTYQYRYVLIASGLIFTTFCLIGALQMRKLKKGGFILYVIGELAPIVISAALIGFSFFGGITMGLTAIIALVFVILYATQRKYLVN